MVPMVWSGYSEPESGPPEDSFVDTAWASIGSERFASELAPYTLSGTAPPRAALHHRRSLHDLAAQHCRKILTSHPPHDRTASNLPAFLKSLLPDLARTIGLPVVVPDPADLITQHLVALPAARTTAEIGVPARVAVERRRSGQERPRIGSISQESRYSAAIGGSARTTGRLKPRTAKTVRADAPAPRTARPATLRQI